jgi:protein O-GlcNAc transferase
MTVNIDAARLTIAQRPDDPAAHFALAQALDAAGEVEPALDALRDAIRLHPAYAEAHNLMGILYASSGEFDKAGGSFQLALKSKPDYSRAWNNLGNALKSAGRLAEAEQAMTEAIRLQPDYQLGHHNLGVVRYGQGKTDEAVQAFAASLKLDMQFRPSWVMGASAERQRGRLDEAVAALRQAIALDPANSADERIALAETLSECGLHAEALRTYEEARQLNPQSGPQAVNAELGLYLTLPQVYPDAIAVDEARSRYTAGLDVIDRDLERSHAGLDSITTLEAWKWSNFLLAYQGRDDRALQEHYAGIVARAIDRHAPEWREPLPERSARGTRIRVGFASAFFVDGTVGQYFKRWITGLDTSRFEVFVYHLTSRQDAVTAEIAQAADVARFPLREPDPMVARIAAQIRNDDLDVLIYPELGMDARCMALAALRLARVQCAAWGHPVTSGHATIDHFFTAGAMEPERADAHYTEKLVRLPGIGTSYPRPPAPRHPPEPARGGLRQRLGLAADQPVFICPQALFKILPDDDGRFARVLQAVPRSVLLLFEGRHRVATTTLMKRLSGAVAAQGLAPRERLRVLSRVSREDFLQINAACDAMLDTHHWSGGNSSLDAIASGLPIVNIPGEFMRGRQTAAMLRMTGADETIAADDDHYVRIAARLATEPAWRTEVAARMQAGAGALFDDAEPIVALADFLNHAVPASR